MVEEQSKYLSKKAWLYSLGLGIILQLLISRILRDVPGVNSAWEIFRFQTTFDPQFFTSVVISWDVTQLDLFLTHYQIDFIYPLVYSYFLAVSIYLLRPYATKIFWLPVIAGICDFIENSMQMSNIDQIMNLNLPMFYVGAAAASVKWLLIVVSLIFILYFYLTRKKNSDFAT